MGRFKVIRKDQLNQIAIFCLSCLGLVYLFLLTPGSKLFLQHKSPYLNDELGSALANASNVNNTVIIAIVNKAYIEGDRPLLDLFVNSFWLGEKTQYLINHLLLVTVDQRSFERCKFLRLHCYKLQTDGVGFDKEVVYMSDEFMRMMWRRTLFLGEVLKRGYSFIFSDVDVLWVRDPFPKLAFHDNVDLQISTDKFNGDQWSNKNVINTGFYMIRSNKQTIKLYDTWYRRKNSSAGLKDQDVLNKMMKGGVFDQLGLKVRFLDTLYFSGFCEDSEDFRVVTTIHANCCRTIHAKVLDLMAIVHEWNRFRKSYPSKSSRFGVTYHGACMDSWN